MALWPFKSAIEKHVDSAIEEQIFEQVAREMHSNDIRPGLWAKAFAESNGDPDRTRARYISLRANSIVKEIAAQQELLAKTAAQQSNVPAVSRTIPCPKCKVNLRFRDTGELTCRCPQCKTTFRVDSSNRIYDIGCTWD